MVMSSVMSGPWKKKLDVHRFLFLHFYVSALVGYAIALVGYDIALVWILHKVI